MEQEIYGHIVTEGKLIKSNDLNKTDKYVEFSVVLDNNNDGVGELYTVFSKHITYDGQDPDVYKRIAVKGGFIYVEGELTNNFVIHSKMQISLPTDKGDKYIQGDKVIIKRICKACGNHSIYDLID